MNVCNKFHGNVADYSGDLSLKSTNINLMSCTKKIKAHAIHHLAPKIHKNSGANEFWAGVPALELNH